MRKQICSVFAISGVLLFMLLFFNSCIQEETFAKATVETNQVTSITEATATCVGIVTADGGSDVTTRGFCWGTNPSPTSANNKITNGSGTGYFTSNITGLTPVTTYYVRSIAVNSVGTSYGNEVSFTTQSGVIGLTTKTITSITAYTAASGGAITSDGGAPITERGICWNTNPSPTIANNKITNGSGTGYFNSSITGLTPATTYYVRSYAVNSVGITYGNEVSFIALSGVVDLTTTTTSALTAFTAMSGGSILSDGGASVTARGVCWSTSPDPTTTSSKTTDGVGLGNYASIITGLTANTHYYVRAYAMNNIGTVYGNQQSFTSQNIITDIDGNMYNTVKIGAQTWTVENLKTTKYNDGTSIPFISDGAAWSALSSPGCCFYNNDAANKTAYGALYNWYTVNTGKLAPSGWHVPTSAEWTILENYLMANGYNYDGTTTGNKIAKSLADITGWLTSTNPGAIGNNLTKNNTSGFAALPGGYRQYLGDFSLIGVGGEWWSSTEFDTYQAWYSYLFYNCNFVGSNQDYKRFGRSIRCVRD